MIAALALCCLITGTVHAGDGSPLANASVQAGAANNVAHSDARGAFSIRVNAGSYVLRASDTGYRAAEIGPIRIDAATQLSIVLEPLDWTHLRTISHVTVNGRLVPASGTIPSVTVTRTQMAQLGQTQIVQALQDIPSLDVQYPHNGAAAGLATVSLRGPDPSETMITLDGQLLNDENTGDIDISQLPSAAFSAVSVTEGLGPQDLEASSTIGGAVNLISLEPTPQRHAAFSLAAGSFGQSDAWYNATGTQSRLGYALALDDRHEAGYVNETDLVCPISGSAPCVQQHLGSASAQQTALANLRYSLGERADAGVRFFTMGDARDQSAAIAGYDGSTDGAIDSPGPQTFSQSIRAYEAYGRAPLGAGELVGSASISDNNVDVAGSGIGNPMYDLSHRDERTLQSIRWERDFADGDFAAGALFGQEQFIAPGAIPQLAQSTHSYFMRGGWQPAQRWHLAAALYHARYSTFGNSTDGRLGAIFDLDARTTLHASLGTGFRAPLLIERYVFPLDQLPPPDNNCVQTGQGNPNEMPEHATEYEVGASRELSSDATLDAAFYRTNLRDPIENYYPTGTQNPGCAQTYVSYPINIGNAVYQGAELHYRQRVARGLFLNAMYGLNIAFPENLPVSVSNPTSGSTLVDGRQFADIPQQQASLEADYTGSVWHAGVSADYRGANNPLNAGPLLFIDAAVGRSIAPNLDLTLAGRNLTNTDAGKFQVFGGGIPYNGIVAAGTLGNIPTNLLTVEPASFELIATFKR